MFKPMKTIMLVCILMGFASATLAIEPAELDNRVRTLTAKFEAFQQQPGKGIPAETLRAAHGIILLDRTKAGFLFAYQGGGGVAMVKDPTTQAWSPVAFLGASEASLGFQIGGEQDFYVILLMTPDAANALTNPNIEFGGEARGTAAGSSGGVEGKLPNAEQPVLVYADHEGLYGGAVIKGGAISPDDKDNRTYYGQYVSMRDVLFDHKVQPTGAASSLANVINSYSQDQERSKTAAK
jgi:lipid-binding SYLF domain-containing protein